jgi:hypothetical protein
MLLLLDLIMLIMSGEESSSCSFLQLHVGTDTVLSTLFSNILILYFSQFKSNLCYKSGWAILCYVVILSWCISIRQKCYISYCRMSAEMW